MPVVWTMMPVNKCRSFPVEERQDSKVQEIQNSVGGGEGKLKEEQWGNDRTRKWGPEIESRT